METIYLASPSGIETFCYGSDATLYFVDGMVESVYVYTGWEIEVATDREEDCRAGEYAVEPRTYRLESEEESLYFTHCKASAIARAGEMGWPTISA